MLGGDSDTVGAITGAIAGANLGAAEIPRTWLERLAEWPRTVDWLRRLAEQLEQTVRSGEAQRPIPMRWLATVPRNLLFAVLVIGLGLRRLAPPY